MKLKYFLLPMVLYHYKKSPLPFATSQVISRWPTPTDKRVSLLTVTS